MGSGAGFFRRSGPLGCGKNEMRRGGVRWTGGAERVPPGGAGTSDRKERELLELSAQNRFAAKPEPVVKNGRVDAPEVEADLEIAVLQLGQARRCADQPPLDS